MMADDYYRSNNLAFQKVAPFYNLMASPFFRIRKKVVDISGVKRGDTVLDVCTGTGSQALAFGRKGYDVTGVDISPDMLRVARKRNRYRNVRFDIADATRLPFGDKQFDVATISLALHDMPREVRPGVLEEMKRVSKRIVVIDYNVPDNRLLRWLYVSFTALYELGYYRDFTRQNIRELLQQQGLKVVREDYPVARFVRISVCEITAAATT